MNAETHQQRNDFNVLGRIYYHSWGYTICNDYFGIVKKWNGKPLLKLRKVFRHNFIEK